VVSGSAEVIKLTEIEFKKMLKYAPSNTQSIKTYMQEKVNLVVRQVA
jgi:hypothetical protein